MAIVRFLLTGSRNDADTVINALHGIDGIEHVEEVDDLQPKMRDDSSSSQLVDDSEGQVYYIEVMAPTNRIETVRVIAESQAADRGLGVEFVERF
jgi:hypothetical protein